MIPQDGITLEYLNGALRRRPWHAVGPFFVILMAALLYCVKAPKTYRSSTLILVQPQEVPADYVKSTVTSDATARLHTLQEQVMSRPRLEEIIEKYNLYQKARSAGTMFDAVEIMRKHITLEVKESKNARDTAPAAFEVSYEGSDPTTVRDVTAAIAQYFIEDDLRLRERMAAGTSQFLDRELGRMRKDLREKEERVRRFKEENLGLLPEQMENNYRILEQLQRQLDSQNVSLQQTEDRKVLLQGQLSRLDTLRTQTGDTGLAVGSSDDQRPGSLEEARQQLNALQSRFSDQYPDVIKLKSYIAKLEGAQQPPDADDEAEVQSQAVSSAPSEAQRLIMVQREDMLTQLRLIDREIAKLAEEKRHTSWEIKKYRERIENGPKIEQMFVDLRRDYEEASQSYQSLLEKKLQADLAENLERTQKGEQFQILEPANLPEKPFKPNIPKIVLLGLMAAAAAGFGLAFIKDARDPTYFSGKHLESELQLPVIATIPVIITPKRRRLGLYKRIGTTSALISLSLILAYTVFVLLKNNPTLLPFAMR